MLEGWSKRWATGCVILRPMGSQDTESRNLRPIFVDHTCTESWFTLSANTMQKLSVGQTVTIEWEGYGTGAFIDEYQNSGYHTHWTGEYLGPSTAALPECQSEGQGRNSIKKKIGMILGL